jgi:predicted acylesterase/phospholipase RssA
MEKCLLLSGGGMRGIAYIGVFKILQKSGILEKLQYVCGVSIGAAFCLLLTLGYSYKELREEILSKNFKTLHRVKLKNLMSKWGLDSGDGLKEWLETFLIKKGFDREVTFSELQDKVSLKLNVVTTNLSKSQLVLLNSETSPDLKVVDGILMSMAVPFVFCSREWQGDIYVDGAVLSNLPINLCKEKLGISSDELLAVKLDDRNTGGEIGDLKSFVSALGKCIIRSNETCENLISIDISDTPHLDFQMTKETKRYLIKCGIRDTENWYRYLGQRYAEKGNIESKVPEIEGLEIEGLNVT